MHIKLVLLTLLSYTWLQGMQKKAESFLDLLPQDLVIELKKYAPTRLDQLPPNIQKELIFFIVKSLIQLEKQSKFSQEKEYDILSASIFKVSDVLPSFMRLEEFILSPLRLYFDLPIFLKSIEVVICILSQGESMFIPRIAAALDIPAVTEWLKKQIIIENIVTRRDANYEFYCIVGDNLGQSKYSHTWNKIRAHEQETADEKQKRFALEKLLYTTLENLLKSGVDINSQEDDRTMATRVTSLIRATGYCDSTTVRFLLKYGARKDLKNNSDHTALDIAELRLKEAQLMAAVLPAIPAENLDFMAVIKKYQKIIELLKKDV